LSNKETAGKLIGDGIDEDIDRTEESHRQLLAAIGYALLDVAHAIREQTAAIRELVAEA
jgi:hypothetical protein